jgi:signal transduction histidine kinase
MSTSTRSGNWHTRAAASEVTPRSDAAATLGVLYAAGAVLSSVLVATPQIGASDTAFMLVSAAVALVAGTALWVYRPPLSQPVVFAAVVIGTTWMGADAYALSVGGTLLCIWFGPVAFALVTAAPAIAASAYAIAVPGIIFSATGALTARTGSSTAVKQWVIVAGVIVASSAAVYIYSRRTIERDERRRLEEQRAELASLLVSAQEDERRRIASEVHDDPLQALIALSLELQILERRTTEQPALAAIADLKDSVKQAIEQLRGLLFELHPPALELGGLSDSLRELIRRYEAVGGPRVDFETAIAPEPTPEEAVVLFRITSEALTNIRKHANATRVSVSLVESQGGIALSVVDDGVGIVGDANVVVPGHFGVASMRARATRAGGSVEVTSRPGKGTTVLAWIPRQDTA